MNNNTEYERIRNEKYYSAMEFFIHSQRSYKNGEVILKPEEFSRQIMLMESGVAVLKSVNDFGEESILDIYTRGDIFGGVFKPKENVNLYYICAKNTCKVCIPAEKSMTEYTKDQKQRYYELVKSIVEDNFSRQMLHIDILSQRNIRNKLMVYFSAISKKQGNRFTLPLSLTDTADFIGSDRSAMMRELRKLKDEGIIMSEGRSFCIISE